jgi:hypothetical protein
MTEMSGPHDFVPYLQSLTDELTAIRNRVRLLVKNWPADGHFKEVVLRQVLRRHLPESVFVGTGFVVNTFGPSGEIDVLIVDRAMPTLFKEDELLIVTPESVKAVVEVKTRLGGPSAICEAVAQLAQRKADVQQHVQCKDVWAGLFVYEGNDDRHVDLLRSVGEARSETHAVVDCVAYGDDTLVKFSPVPENEGGREPSNAWHTFHIPGIAPANFVASLIETLVPQGKDPGSFAWFKPPEGFERRYYLLTRARAEPQRF